MQKQAATTSATKIHMPFGTQLRWRAALAAAFSAVVPIAILVAAVLPQMEQKARETGIRQLELISELKYNQVVGLLEEAHSAVDLFLSDPIMRSGLDVFVDQPNSSALPNYNRRLREAVRAYTDFQEVFAYDTAGRIQAASDETQVGRVVAAEAYFKPSLQAPYTQPPYLEPESQAPTMLITKPLADQRGRVIGALAARLDMGAVNAILTERTGLGETGETYWVSADGSFLVTSSHFEGYPAGQSYSSEGIDTALRGASGSSVYDNYRTPPARVIGVYRWLPDLHVAMMTEIEESEVLASTREVESFSLVIAALVALVVAVGGFVVVFYLARPLVELTEVATHIAAGNFDRRARVTSNGEIHFLANAFNSMATQIMNLVNSLEERVAARTHDLAAIGEIGRVATQIHELDALLPQIVDLIRDRFGFYHAQIFLLDENSRHAVLKSSTGDIGQELLRRRHSLSVGSASVIGQVTERNEPIVALDTEDATVVHRPNPLLPNTRSEMALPLRVGGRVIGALDVQSTEPRAFDAHYVNLFQTLADQIAVAISNATLLGELQARVREIERLNRQLIGETWYQHIGGDFSQAPAFTADLIGVQPAAAPTAEQDRALASGEVVVRHEDAMVRVALPVRYGGAVVGCLEFTIDREGYSDEKLSLAQMLADRLGVSVESARLFEQAQRLVAHERQVNAVTSQLQGESELDRMMIVAAEEIRRALRARRAAVRLDVE